MQFSALKLRRVNITYIQFGSTIKLSQINSWSKYENHSNLNFLQTNWHTCHLNIVYPIDNVFELSLIYTCSAGFDIRWSICIIITVARAIGACVIMETIALAISRELDLKSKSWNICNIFTNMLAKLTFKCCNELDTILQTTMNLSYCITVPVF